MKSTETGYQNSTENTVKHKNIQGPRGRLIYLYSQGQLENGKQEWNKTQMKVIDIEQTGYWDMKNKYYKRTLNVKVKQKVTNKNKINIETGLQSHYSSDSRNRRTAINRNTKQRN